MENSENKSILAQERQTSSINENDQRQRMVAENAASASSESELSSVLPNEESAVDNQQEQKGIKIENSVNDPTVVLQELFSEALKNPSENNLVQLSVESTKMD